MKRMKFLNGISAMIALVGVAIATTFTSCEKEDFNVSVDPINAQATIETTVLYVGEDGTKNVTDDPKTTITYSAGPTFTGSPTLSAQTVTVTASYNGLTNTATVNVPALGAGQFLSMSTTIILQEAAPAPVNAKAEVKPVVLLLANGTSTDITEDATITFSPDNDGVFEGDPENGGILEATTSTITATYGEGEDQLSGTVTVEIPSLLAGQYATLSPTIILTQMPEEANAIAEIRPIVLHMTASAVVDVTDKATITYDPDNGGRFEGAPALEAATSTITATYEDLTNTVVVNVPALEAGQYTTLTPTIILMDAIEVPVVTIDSEITRDEAVENRVTEHEDNVSDYWYNTTVTYTEKKGNLVLATDVQTTDLEEMNLIYSFANAVNTYTETKVEREVPVYSHSRTIVTVSYNTTEVTYSFYRVTTMQPLTKSDDRVLIGSVVVKEYMTEMEEPQLNQQIPGHGHTPMGHGHGFDHGHGNGNAGGGIVIAD